jgi:2-C-methyl-D-erythritol 4-phosphate cytidylyltransferase
MTNVTVLPSASVVHAETPGDRTSPSDLTVSTSAEHDSDGVWTIVVGGGTGQRFGAAKQYESLGAGRVIDRSRAIAARCSHGVVVVVPASDAAREDGVAGGATRSESVREGLAHVPMDAEIICVHDAARPLASADLYRRVIAAVRGGADAAIPGIAVTDTIKVLSPAAVGDGILGAVASTPDRSKLIAVQTPQAFRADRLRSAHSSAGDATDDAALVEAAGGRVVVVAGDPMNRKITEPDDLIWARRHVAEIDNACASGTDGKVAP